MPYLQLYVDNIANAVDIVSLIEEMKWSENDLDSPNSGRDLQATMYRGKVASKRRCDIKLMPCRASVLNEIFPIIRHEYFYCYTDLVPAEGPLLMQMYNSTRSGGIAIITSDLEGDQVVHNVIKHKDVSFNIIER